MLDRATIKSNAKAALKGRWLRAVGVYTVYTLLASIFAIIISRVDPVHNMGMWFAVYLIYIAIMIFALMPICVSLYGYFLKIYRGKSATIGDAFSAFGANYTRYLSTMLWMMLWIMIWELIAFIGIFFIPIFFGIMSYTGIFVGILLTLVLSVPAIIKSYAYMLTPFVIYEYPELGARKALRVSMAMTDGNKGKLFVMMLSFLGWFLIPIAIMSIGAVAFTSMLFSGNVAGGTIVLIASALIGTVITLFIQPYYLTTIAGYYAKLKEIAIDSGKIQGFDGAASTDEIEAAATPEPNQEQQQPDGK